MRVIEHRHTSNVGLLDSGVAVMIVTNLTAIIVSQLDVANRPRFGDYSPGRMAQLFRVI
jgi:hypothetical protein